jgi:hypothetical protein
VARQRVELGINREDAVVAIVISRTSPGKGSPATLEAVENARVASGRDIHLVLIDHGPISDELLQSTVPAWLHLLGDQGRGSPR